MLDFLYLPSWMYTEILSDAEVSAPATQKKNKENLKIAPINAMNNNKLPF